MSLLVIVMSCCDDGTVTLLGTEAELPCATSADPGEPEEVDVCRASSLGDHGTVASRLVAAVCHLVL
jgi:hypothetical protein